MTKQQLLQYIYKKQKLVKVFDEYKEYLRKHKPQ